MSRDSEKLKKGDKVVMHTCGEAKTAAGKIWTCKTDQFTRGTGVYEQDSVFLEGYSGSFAPEFLQMVILPSEDESLLAALEEAKKERDDWHNNYLRAVADAEDSPEIIKMQQERISDLAGELSEAQLAIEAMHEHNRKYAAERDRATRLLAEAQQTIEELNIALDMSIEETNKWSTLVNGAAADNERLRRVLEENRITDSEERSDKA